MITAAGLRGKRNGYRVGAVLFGVFAVIAATLGSVLYAAGCAVGVIANVGLAVLYQRLYLKQLHN